MSIPLFDDSAREIYSISVDMGRVADALEGLLALLKTRLPVAAPAAAPAPVPTPSDVPPAAADPGDEDDSDDTDDVDYTRRTRWAKYDDRCRELARLRTAAKHRRLAAKTHEVKVASRAEERAAMTESNSRHKKLRQLLADGKIMIIDDVLYRIDDNGARVRWQSAWLTQN
jgi:hypothetical protein